MSFEKRLKTLMAKKLAIQKLETERNQNKDVWLKAGKKVKSLSQEIAIKTKELMESI